jgi:hypothetical protein
LQFGHLMENKCSEVTLESESILRTYYTVSPLFAQFADRVTAPRATGQMLVYLETLGERVRVSPSIVTTTLVASVLLVG